MPNLQTASVSAVGGLDLVSPPTVLSQKPGAAVVLNNHEVLHEGGFRRIHGYTPTTALPAGVGDIRGIHIFDDRVLVVRGGDILHLQSNNTWLKVNPIDLTGTDRVQMTTIQTAMDPQILICDPDQAPVLLEVDTFNVYTVTPVTPEPALRGVTVCTTYQDHVVVSGNPNEPGQVAVSTRFDPTTFNGTGSWEFRVPDVVTGLHVFRQALYVFCKESIYRVTNLTQAQNAVVEPVTNKIGCVDGFTIQEIGGDVLFLANDGLRYLGGTARIDDVSIDIQSEPITPLMETLSKFAGNMSSCVIADKRQYRLFAYTASGVRIGVIGTLMNDGKFAWSTTSDMEVEHIFAGDINQRSITYHASESEVFLHESGDDFNGSEFIAIYTTPYFNLGDSQIRKRAHSVTVFFEAEEQAALILRLKFDYDNVHTIQPDPFPIAQVVTASRYGVAEYGTAFYGAVRFPLEKIFLEGSGNWMQFEFRDNDPGNSRYIIRGYDLNFSVGGRI